MVNSNETSVPWLVSDQLPRLSREGGASSWKDDKEPVSSAACHQPVLCPGLVMFKEVEGVQSSGTAWPEFRFFPQYIDSMAHQPFEPQLLIQKRLQTDQEEAYPLQLPSAIQKALGGLFCWPTTGLILHGNDGTVA